jgi:hypothetical protein
MIETVVELVIIGMWTAILSIHTRRLLRLANVEPLLSNPRDQRLRVQLNRVWWWLGREEFWRGVESDGVRCIQCTVMLFLFVWGIAG